MNLSRYFPNLVQKTKGLSPDEIKLQLRRNSNATFHVVSSGFNIPYLSSLLFYPNVKLIFSSDDHFTLEEQIAFIENQMEEDRERLLFLSSYYDMAEIDALVAWKPSLVAWRVSKKISLPPSKIHHWANLLKGGLTLVAKGYSEEVVRKCLTKPLSVLICKGDFDNATIQELAQRGKFKVKIIADGFEKNDLDTFKKWGSVVLEKVEII